MTATGEQSTGLPGTARALLLLLFFSLAVQRPSVRLLGFDAIPSDFIYLLLLVPLAAAFFMRQVQLPRDRIFLFIGLYFLTLALSTFASPQPLRSAVKLLTQLYLISLAIIPPMLISTERQMRDAFLWWLAGTAFLALLCLASVIAFYAWPQSGLLRFTLNIYGTLMPGPYPRLRLSFEYANQLCNYLSVSLLMILVARYLEWIGGTAFRLLLTGTLMAAAFTVSPSLGGIFLTVGTWIWLLRNRSGPLARLALAAGVAAAILFLLASTVTPFLHPTAPYLIHIPFTHLVMAPAVRLMTWTEAFQTFLSSPLLGRGIGQDSVNVVFVIPTGEPQFLTDAHNSFLNLAAQAGIVGVTGFVLLLWQIARMAAPFRLEPQRKNAVRLALDVAILGALVYQGLTGSFEDSRHLWLALGLLIAAHRIEMPINRSATASDP